MTGVLPKIYLLIFILKNYMRIEATLLIFQSVRSNILNIMNDHRVF